MAAATLATQTPAMAAGSAGTSGSATVAARLQHQLNAALKYAGSGVGVLVENVSSGQVLFSRNSGIPRPPASVEKLYTTVAAVNLLGANARFQTAVLGKGALEPGGVWHGNLYLRGSGDPTFGDGAWNRTYEDGRGPTALQLTVQLRHAGIRRVTGHIFADESLFDTDRGGPATHNKPDTPDYGGELSALVYDHGMSTAKMSPAVFAAHELAVTMRAAGIQVGAAARTMHTPAGSVKLAHVESPPLSVLVRLMDVPSDDLIADMLAKQLGARQFHEGTLAAGAIEIRQAIRQDYDLSPVLFDGSGLDHADRSTPTEVVSLLQKMWLTPTGNLLHAALPVVGEQGTVADMGVHTPAQGNCVAKTGTLNNVTNLAGYCSARGGQTLAFAVMIDGPPNYLAIPMLSSAVAAIARY
ncbi:MAG TPA: D-alanyl-D-alanine carboxypeptidase [Solirubrobacteraceae bacterium]|nr:D-alanyl-D-alanine carboxypeptidase [Solirubrobacteraceae bacterium]